jgi:hypothetical protein
MAEEIADALSNIVEAITPAAEAVAAPKSAPKPKKTKQDPTEKKAKKEYSKVKVQPKTIEEFYIARGKDPKKCIITENGDLLAKAIKPGEADRIFTLPKYREITVDEKIALDSSRREQLAILEIAVQEAQTNLREVYLGYKNGDIYASDVVIANQNVAQAEKALQNVAYPLKQVNTNDSLETRKILLDSRYEDRKIPYSVHIFKHFSHELQTAVSETPLPQEDALPQPQPQPQQEAPVDAPEPREMTAADRGRLGGILKVRRTRPRPGA